MTARTLVLGLGNPTRGDDRVGHAVLEGLDGLPAAVDTRVTILSDVRLLTLIEGYEAVIVVDAVPVESEAVGRWWHRDASAVAAHEHPTDFSHELSLGRLVDLAGDGERSPTVEAFLVGIEPRDGCRITLTDRLSPAVRRAVEPVQDAVVARARQLIETGDGSDVGHEPLTDAPDQAGRERDLHYRVGTGEGNP